MARLRSFGRALLRLAGARQLAAAALFIVLIGALLYSARGIEPYGPNLALDLGAEIIGAFVILFAITPLVRRAQQGRVREHRRLDFAWFNTKVAGAKAHVRILHTFTRLLEGSNKVRFFQTLVKRLETGVEAQILLLHPDSPAAVRRTEDLAGSGTDVALRVRANLRALDDFVRGLDDDLSPRVQVRLYSSTPTVQVYQCDDQVLTSFFPVGVLSGDHTQLEVAAGTPLGEFVGRAFDELWEHSTSLADYMTATVVLNGPDGRSEYVSPYIVSGDTYYFTSPELIDARDRLNHDAVHAQVSHEPEVLFAAHIAPEVSQEVAEGFKRKYATHARAILRLTPSTDAVPRTLA